MSACIRYNQLTFSAKLGGGLLLGVTGVTALYYSLSQTVPVQWLKWLMKVWLFLIKIATVRMLSNGRTGCQSDNVVAVDSKFGLKVAFLGNI